MASGAQDPALTRVSVAYANKIKPPVKMTKKARATARRKLRVDGEPVKPFGMSSTRKRIRPSDPKQNNPNDIGAKIISPGQGVM